MMGYSLWFDRLMFIFLIVHLIFLSTFFVEFRRKNIIFIIDWKDSMKIQFDKDYLKELYFIGKTTNKKYRFQPQIIQKYRKTIDVLESVEVIEELFRFKSLNYKVLSGDKNGIESVRVNDQYRIEFKTSKFENEKILTVCNIIELSNHYK